MKCDWCKGPIGHTAVGSGAYIRVRANFRSKVPLFCGSWCSAKWESHIKKVWK